MADITRLRTDRRDAPLGIDSPEPEFSWSTEDEQQAYEIELTASTFDEPLWRSGRIDDPRPYGARYAGPPLESRTAYSWRVRVHAAHALSAWSETASFETGLLAASDWTAHWVAEPERAKNSPPRTRYFTHRFSLPAGVIKARAYASSLGWYRLHINGNDQTGPALVPRWTPFDEIVEYQVYDIADALTQGDNSVVMVVSEGRFRGALGTSARTSVYGDRLAAILQIEVEFADGSTAVVVTDPSWLVGEGQILTADPKKGERVDLRVSPDPQQLRPVAALTPHRRRLVAEELDRVTAVGTFTPSATRTPTGVQLFDFGQNFNGVARVRLHGPEGSTAVIRYSEVLTPDGELEMDYLEFTSAKDWFQRDEVVLGSSPAEYTPSFTIRGFRYITVEGAGVHADDVIGIELSTPLAVTARFQASDPRLEQMDRTTMASLRANFSDTATDCPTRERTGWTGDLQVFAPTAAILVDSGAFLRRYLRNLAIEQAPDGRVPTWIPAEESEHSKSGSVSAMAASVGWGDAAVLVPWTLYQYSGDTEVLRRQWSSALAWVEQLERRARKTGLARRLRPRLGTLERFIVDTGFHFGEWLRPGESSFTSIAASIRRPPAEIATAYFALSSKVLSEMAAVLGDVAQADRWRDTSANVRKAWRAAFVRDGGSRVALDRQDDYVRALEFDLLLPEERPAAAARLAELVTANGDHLATGFLSTPLLLQALSNNGYSHVAYRVLLQDTVPSWLGQLDRGATTWWETWEGYKKNGRAKVSHDHYAFGSVSRFLHENIAGLRPLEPAYRRFLVAPVIGGGLQSASTAIQTPYGTAASGWHVIGDLVSLEVTVPPGTSATISFSGVDEPVGPGEHTRSFPVAAPVAGQVG